MEIIVKDEKVISIVFNDLKAKKELIKFALTLEHGDKLYVYNENKNKFIDKRSKAVAEIANMSIIEKFNLKDALVKTLKLTCQEYDPKYIVVITKEDISEIIKLNSEKDCNCHFIIIEDNNKIFDILNKEIHGR